MATDKDIVLRQSDKMGLYIAHGTTHQARKEISGADKLERRGGLC